MMRDIDPFMGFIFAVVVIVALCVWAIERWDLMQIERGIGDD